MNTWFIVLLLCCVQAVVIMAYPTRNKGNLELTALTRKLNDLLKRGPGPEDTLPGQKFGKHGNDFKLSDDNEDDSPKLAVEDYDFDKMLMGVALANLISKHVAICTEVHILSGVFDHIDSPDLHHYLESLNCSPPGAPENPETPVEPELPELPESTK